LSAEEEEEEEDSTPFPSHVCVEEQPQLLQEKHSTALLVAHGKASFENGERSAIADILLAETSLAMFPHEDEGCKCNKIVLNRLSAMSDNCAHGQTLNMLHKV